jgi:hypothetical protein
VLSRTSLLAPVAAAATVAASLLFVADPSANAAGICTTPPTVNVTDSGNSVSATILANPCDDGVEAALETLVHGGGYASYYGGDVKAVGKTSSITGPGELVQYGYRYWANKNGTAQWYYEWFV